LARVAVDVMGGDYAPSEVVAGCVQAHQGLGIPVLLVGDESRVHEELGKAGTSAREGLEVVHADDVIAMDEADPARAVRSRRTSSVSIASRLVKEGRADAVVSAGSTGAALAAAVLEIGRIRGVQRPAITTLLPFPGSPTVLIDAGASSDSRPEHLETFGVLGSMFAESYLGLDKPRVGLLSIGEEPGKGNELVKEAFPLLERSGLLFIGNVEGRDIPTDRVDVVVCDGFTGNVALKLLEGFASYLMGELLKIFTSSDEAKQAATVVMPGLLELRETLSPEAHGGAQLLGVGGVCIIAHGSSNARAVHAAVRVASQTADSGFVGRVAERFSGRPGGRDDRGGPQGRAGLGTTKGQE
jgi:glycerol-3-phosphate acyltransferase PlsX